LRSFCPPAIPWLTIADVLNWGSWLAFLAKVVVVLAVVRSRGAWLRKHPLEVATVVLTPPFLTSVVQSVRVLRLLPACSPPAARPLVRVLFTAEGIRYAALLTALTTLAGAAACSSVENTLRNGL
jgi:hypothetical protein